MSRLESGPAGRRNSSSNVYTVLSIVAVICLTVAVVVVWAGNVSQTGSANPFHVVSR